MARRQSRRQLIGRAVSGIAGVALGLAGRETAAQANGPMFGYPIGLPGRLPGDGFVIRHGYATENTWYNPGWWHAGEDWYLAEGSGGDAGDPTGAAGGDAAGATVYAAGAGEVVFVGSEYPGLVVILRHAAGAVGGGNGGDLFTMYGHLAYDVPVRVGQRVARGDVLGTVLPRADGRAPSHLHFEARTFLTAPEVNGDAPRYGVACGFQCPPGPGYWPIDAPEHPSAMGWRNPTHVLAAGFRSRVGGEADGNAEAVVAATAPAELALWSQPEGDDGAEPVGPLTTAAGDRLAVLAVDVGAPDSSATGAEATRLWFRTAAPGGGEGWVRAAVPFAGDTGADGRPSSLRLVLLPAIGGE
jgi:murein DD-endopeptidase MepM/ murein hydrolase activator NlpD